MASNTLLVVALVKPRFRLEVNFQGRWTVLSSQGRDVGELSSYININCCSTLLTVSCETMLCINNIEILSTRMMLATM